MTAEDTPHDDVVSAGILIQDMVSAGILLQDATGHTEDGSADDTAATPPSPFHISRASQAADPKLAVLLERLEGTRSRSATSAVQQQYHLDDEGLLRYYSTNSEGLACSKLCVPDALVGPLLRHYHFSCHRGHEPLYSEVSQLFHWEGMQRQCQLFTDACEVCSGVKSRNMAKAPVVPVPTPSRPFEVVHVDHKGPLRRSGGYTNVLVIVCALTLPK